MGLPAAIALGTDAAAGHVAQVSAAEIAWRAAA